ncbi:MAG: hypothetical protein ACYDCI_10760 [Candidatus Limnocylindrales bacterium]
MGSIVDMRIVGRALAAHGPELVSEAMEELPSFLRSAGASVTLENEVGRLGRTVAVKSPDGGWEEIELRPLTIYDLGERFPDLAID